MSEEKRCPIEEFEQVAAEFYEDTGYLRPGKDQGAADPVDPDDRQLAWDSWNAARRRFRAETKAPQGCVVDENGSVRRVLMEGPPTKVVDGFDSVTITTMLVEVGPSNAPASNTHE